MIMVAFRVGARSTQVTCWQRGHDECIIEEIAGVHGSLSGEEWSEVERRGRCVTEVDVTKVEPYNPCLANQGI